MLIFLKEMARKMGYKEDSTSSSTDSAKNGGQSSSSKEKVVENHPIKISDDLATIYANPIDFGDQQYKVWTNVNKVSVIQPILAQKTTTLTQTVSSSSTHRGIFVPKLNSNSPISAGIEFVTSDYHASFEDYLQQSPFFEKALSLGAKVLTLGDNVSQNFLDQPKAESLKIGLALLINSRTSWPIFLGVR